MIVTTNRKRHVIRVLYRRHTPRRTNNRANVLFIGVRRIANRTSGTKIVLQRIKRKFSLGKNRQRRKNATALNLFRVNSNTLNVLFPLTGRILHNDPRHHLGDRHVLNVHLSRTTRQTWSTPRNTPLKLFSRHTSALLRTFRITLRLFRRASATLLLFRVRKLLVRYLLNNNRLLNTIIVTVFVTKRTVLRTLRLLRTNLRYLLTLHRLVDNQLNLDDARNDANIRLERARNSFPRKELINRQHSPRLKRLRNRDNNLIKRLFCLTKNFITTTDRLLRLLHRHRPYLLNVNGKLLTDNGILGANNGLLISINVPYVNNNRLPFSANSILVIIRGVILWRHRLTIANDHLLFRNDHLATSVIRVRLWLLNNSNSTLGLLIGNIRKTTSHIVLRPNILRLNVWITRGAPELIRNT